MLHINMRKIIISLMLSAFFVLPAQAFEVSPVKMLVTGDPGNNYTVVLKVKNTDMVSMMFDANVFGMKQNESGAPVFERGISEAESWVFPENRQVSVEAGETKSINFFIKIPKDSLPGSYYLGLSAEPTVKRQAGSVSGRLVSLLTLQVSGEVRELLRINQWKKKSDSGVNNWKFALELENIGTVEVPLRGEISVRNFFGQEIISEPAALGNKLLANAKRSLGQELQVQEKVKIPGLYQVNMRVVYGKLGLSVSRTEYVWFIPFWSKIAIGGLGLLVLVLVVRKKMKLKT
jgi:hypothetical protein